MAEATEETRFYTAEGMLQEPHPTARTILRQVAEALQEKGYRPVDQIVGYLVSGDPAYVTSHKDARSLIKQMERDDLLEEVVSYYLRNA